MDKIMEASKEQLEELTKLGMDLYQLDSFKELQDEFNEMIHSDKDKLLLYFSNGEPVAFMHLSIRADYVEGSDSSPTGYIEGVYVKPQYRRKGISTKLFNEGKKWLIEKGCSQVGSDMEMDNQDSHPFHLSLGFREAGRLITFIRYLD